MTIAQSSPFCGGCGARVPAGAKFCEGCGAPVAADGLGAGVQPKDAKQTDPKVKQLFHLASEVEPSQRDAWLVSASNGDENLLSELRSLFAAEHAGVLNPALRTPPRAEILPTEPAPNESAHPQNQLIGPYRLLREIGRGGMGVVYLAVRDDGAFRKNVALKLLLREHVNPEFVSRFKQERQVLAALDHPNIARILDGGNTSDGLPYYVMEFVEGLPLDKYCDQQRLSLTGRIKIFQQVCQSVEYLHSNSIMHRDLKPSNILVSADGVVKLLDFGIAKVTGAGSWANPDLTNLEARPMTPTYASPEQISGAALQKTSDLYSLGAILYNLLTGRPAYQDLDEKIARLQARELPPKPSSNIREDLRSNETTAQFRRAMMGELDSIVLMAMQIDPKDRYQSALAMVEDLQHFLDDSPVTAHHTGAAKRSVRVLRRKSAALAVAAALLLLGALGVWQWQQMERNRKEAASNEAHLRVLLNNLEARLDNVAVPHDGQIQDVRQLKTALQDELAAPGSKQSAQAAEQNELIARGVKYLDRISAAAPANANLNAELGDAYQQLGSLQEKVVKTGSDQREALKIYQKAATALGSANSLEPARAHLAKVNVLIAALGGPAVASAAATSQPQVDSTSQTAQQAPVESAATEAPRPPAVKPLAKRVAREEIPASERPAAEPAAVEPPPQQAPRISPELQEALANAASKAEIAEQTLTPLKQSLERDGQTLNAETLSRLTRMRTSLERAKRSVAAGDAAAAQESIAVTEGLADKLLRSVGR